ncbi:MAG: aminopeptidase P family protein [Bacteroidales bacterium]|nr:aminopeptidase P family protein [Bacteroidales bacterium]
MFEKEVYIRRRKVLKEKMAAAGQSGIAIFIGNVEAPAQYKDNGYKFRQDSTWLYYFGIDEPRYAAIIDIDSGDESVWADDVDIDDIIWMGPQPSVASRAAGTGIDRSGAYQDFEREVVAAMSSGRTVHFIPPSRYYNAMMLRSMLGSAEPSVPLVESIVSMRLVKEDCEIEEIDRACDLGVLMHTTAREAIRPGILEQEIVGLMEGVTLSKGWGVSFPTILSQRGATLHNHLHDQPITPGKLLVVDAGAESNSHYASDFTRTYPTGGKFTPRQRDIYQIVCDCNEYAFSLTRPGMAYRDVHIAVAGKMLEGLKAVGLVRGNVSDMVQAGIAGLFQPHGLGHNMGLDVHDMEDLGEDLVGYDPDQKRSSQPGLGSLRMARRLVPGNVITDEPGIYFIPALIEQWKAAGTGRDFVNFDALKAYYDFGGIRLEDDVLVTADGARRLGHSRLPIQPGDVEDAMNG